MGWLEPKLPDPELDLPADAPFADRLRAACQSWAVDGYGSPLSVYVLYAGKIAAWLAGWLVFCTWPGDLALADLGSWWASQLAFTKFILWIMLFEGLGLGCGSGPLTARYLPPVGGALWFLTPGTTKLPLVDLPLIGGHRRTVLDVLLTLATYGTLLGALLTEPTTGHLVTLAVLVPLLGLLDRTLFLVFRSEHYLSVVFCLLSADWIAGSKVVWLAIWWWAATSKLNHHFPSVMGVMTSNAPWTRFFPALRRSMYVDWPTDLRPSTRAAAFAHFGTATEYVVPLMLVLGDGGPLTALGLFLITGFHLFILSNVPMGVPLEWNLVMIYGAFVLFGVHADVSLFALSSPLLVAWLVGFHLVLPIVGSMVPERVSFLLAMRYYAGNWAYNVWLFQPGAVDKLVAGVRTWSASPRDQLGHFYADRTVDALLAKVPAFRAMHLQGRALRDLLPRAVSDLDDREWLDGEVVAGLVIGWNFGEGHLSHLDLLQAVQAQCGFEPGEVRCVFVESQPIHRQQVAWRVADAAEGVLDSGTLDVARLREGQPWQIADGPPPVRQRAPVR